MASKKDYWEGKDKKEIFTLARRVQEVYQDYIDDEKKNKKPSSKINYKELMSFALRQVLREEGYDRRLSQSEYSQIRGQIRQAMKEVSNRDEEWEELKAMESEDRRRAVIGGAIANENVQKAHMTADDYAAETYDEMDEAQKGDVWRFKWSKK